MVTSLTCIAAVDGGYCAVRALAVAGHLRRLGADNDLQWTVKEAVASGVSAGCRWNVPSGYFWAVIVRDVIIVIICCCCCLWLL